ETYVEEFPATAEAFRKFLDQIPHRPLLTPTKSVGVVVTPWISTPVPWYALTLALGLEARGARVTMIWDDVAFPNASTAVVLQNRIIGEMLGPLNRLGVLCLSEAAPKKLSAEDENLIGSLAEQNLIWHLRGAEPSAADLRLRD